jgi:hypothetical protein
MRTGRIISLGLTALGLVALSATSITAPASADTTIKPEKPIYAQWTPGNPLPAVPAGYKLMALPAPKVFAAVKIGQKVPLVTVHPGSAAHLKAVYGGLANSAGIVNLEMVPDPGQCLYLGQFKKASYKKRKTVVMQSYSTIAHVTQEFTYGKGQSSSLEVGWSATGKKGTFKFDYDKSQSTDSEQDFPTRHGRSFNHWLTFFSYGKYLNGYTCPAADTWNLMSYQWDAGDAFMHPKGAPNTPFCVQQLAGSKFHKDTTQASTVKVGWTIPALGFSGSAQTGYSAKAKITFIFGRLSSLCGETNTPPNTPGVLVAAPWKKSDG